MAAIGPCGTGTKLEPGRAGQLPAAAFHQQEMVVKRIPAVQVSGQACSGELLALGEFAQNAYRIGVGCEPISGQQVELEALGAEQGVGRQLAFHLLGRERDRGWQIQIATVRTLHAWGQSR